MKFFSSILLGIVAMIFSFQYASAQNELSLGIRLTPDGIGGTSNIFLKKNRAFETQINVGGIVGGGSKSYTISGIYQFYIPLKDANWRIYFGGGFHAGIWKRNNDFFNKEGRTKTNNKNGIFGIDALGGVEYMIMNTPFSISADFKPSINFINEVDLFPNNMFGISFRYYFK